MSALSEQNGRIDRGLTHPLALSVEETELRGLTEATARRTGMEISVWDAQGRPCGYSAGNRTELCRLLHAAERSCEICARADREAFRAARERGGIYCYRCPFGLCEAVAPVCRGGALLGFVMAGKVVQASPSADSEICRLVLGRYPDLGRSLDLNGAIAALPHPDEATLTDCLHLVSSLAFVFAERGSFWQDSPPLADLIRRFLDQELDRRVTLSELSLRFHCSTVTLNAHFRRAYGVSIAHYLAGRRMARAEELLCRTDLTLGEIASRCGFADADYFSRVFSETHGVGPTVYRRGQRP